MRTQLAPLIVVKQEFPDFRTNLIDSSGNDEENNNVFATIKSEHDCNNNQPEDLNRYTKKSKKTHSKEQLLTHQTNPHFHSNVLTQLKLSI